MADLLEIIIGADLKENSIADIKQKIDKLITDYNNKEIRLKLDTNEIDDVVNLSQALANLNQELKQVANQQAMAMAKQNLASKSLLATSRKISQDQLQSLNRQRQGLGQVDKLQSSINKKGEEALKITRKQNDYISQTTKIQDDRIMPTTNINYGGFDKRMQGMADKSRELADSGKIGYQDRKKFADSYKDLNINTDNLNDKLKQSDNIYENLSNKAKALSKNEKEIANARSLLKGYSQEEINNNQKLLAIQKQLSNIGNYKNLEQGKDLGQTKIKYLEEQKKRTDALKQSIKELTDAESKQESLNRRKKGFEKQAKDLADTGKISTRDIERFRKMFNQITEESDDLDGKLDEVNQTFTNLNNKAKALKNNEKEIAKARDILKGKTKEEIEANQHLLRIRNQLANIGNFKNIEQGKNASKEQIRYLQEQKRRTDELKNSIKALADAQREVKNDAKRGVDMKMQGAEGRDLENRMTSIRGMDTSTMEGMRGQNQAVKEWVADTLRLQHGLDNVKASMVQLKPAIDEHGNRMFRVITTYERSNGQMQEYIHTLNMASGRFSYFNDNVRRTSQGFLDTMGRAMQRIPAYVGAYELIYGGFAVLKSGLNTIYEVDKAMTDLEKVTDATAEQMEEFAMQANQIGQNLGALTADVIKATTEFQRLGYTLDESSALAEQSIIYANVGDMGVDEASKTLLSSLRGFGVGQQQVVSESQKYVDIFNEVGNNYAISSAGIGEALQRSASILHVAGNSVEESVAMVTAANATVQDPKKVGNALKTIVMRLQGVSEDGEEILGLQPKLRELFQNIGIDILESSGEMKGSFEIFRELRKEWDSLTQLEQANFAEQLGGKHQGAVVSAMIENWHDAEGAYKSALESMGSADEEYRRYQESMQFQVDRLKNSVEELWMTFWNEEAIKDFLSGLNSAVQGLTKLIDTFGAVGPLAGLITASLMLFNRELRTIFMTPFTGTMQGELRQVGAGFTALTTKVKAFGLALARAFLPIMAFTAIFVILEKLIGKYNEERKKREEYVKGLQTAMQETEEFLKDMEGDPESDIPAFDMQEYQNLEKGAREGTLNNEQYEKFSMLQTEIINKYPVLIDGYDKEGNAILKSSESLENYIKLQKEKMHNDALAIQQATLDDNSGGTTDDWKANINPVDSDFENYEQQLEEVKKAKDELQKFNKAESKALLDVEGLFTQDAKARFKTDKEGLMTDVRSMMSDIRNLELEGDLDEELEYATMGVFGALNKGKFDEAEEWYKQIQLLIEKNRVTLASELGETNADLDKNAQAVKDYMKATFDALKTDAEMTPEGIPLLQELNLAIEENFVDLEGTIVERTDTMDTLFDQIQTQAEAKDFDIGNMFKVENASKTVDFLEMVLKDVKLNKNEAKILTEVLQKLRGVATSQQDKGFDLEKWQSQAYGHYGEWIDEVDRLDQAYRDLTEGEGLTLKGIQELIMAHPELAKHLEQQGDMLGFNAEGVKALQKIRSDAHKDVMAQDKLELESALQKTKGQIGAMFQVGKAYEQLNVLSSKSIQNFKTTRVNEYSQAISAMGDNLPRGRDVSSMVRDYSAELDRQFKPIESMASQLSALEHLMNSVGGAYSNPITSFPSKEKQKEEKVEIYISNKYREALLKLNKELAEQQRIKAQHGKFSAEYQKSLEREIEILKEKVKWTEAERASVKEQLRTGRYITYGTVDVKEAVHPTSATSPNPSSSYSSGAVSRGGYTGQYATEINRYASQYGLDPWLIASVIQQESGFRRTVTSPAGARGLMQLMPATGNSLGVYGDEFWDAGKNIEAGTRYLSQQIKAFGSIQLGLAAYNAGPGNVRKYGGIPPFKETQNYVSRIMSAYGGGGGGSYVATGGGGGGGGGGTVRYGAKGEAVREIQRAVGVAVDGIFGPKTLNAVKNFQRQMGLAVDGIVGSQTWNAIRKGGGGGGTATGGGGGGASYGTIRYGAKGEAVREIQRAVGVAVDGIFGPKTLEAVKKFQRTMGIAVDGIVGSQTWAKIRGSGGGGGGTASGGGSGYTGPTPTTRMWARGEHVKAIQRVVGVAVDGIFGPQTLNAVKKFQQQMGIAVDGIVGPQTWAKIKGASGGGGTGGGAVDSAKSEAEQQLMELELELTDQINELNDAIREAFVAVISNSIAKIQSDAELLTDELARADWEAERATTTADKTKFMEEGLDVIEKQAEFNKQAIAKLWAEYNKRMGEMNEETRHEILKIIQDQELQRIDLEKEIFNRTKAIIDAQLEKFEFEVGGFYSQLEEHIRDMERKLATVDITENPREYLQILNEIRDSQNRLRQAVAGQVVDLEALREKHKDNAEIVKYIDEKLLEMRTKYKDLGDEVYETNEKIKTAFEDLAEEQLDLYKEMLEKRKQGEIETIQDVQEVERKAHEEKIKQWEEELKAMDEVYAKELEQIDKVEAQRSYQNQLEELQEDRQKITDQLGLYAIDTTIEGRANKRRLEEELAEIDKQIEEHRHQRELELKRQAITEEQQDRRENIENQREEAQEILEANEEASQEQIEEIEKRYEEMLNDEKYFNQLREEIIAGNMANITAELQKGTDLMSQYTEELGNNLTINFIDKLKEAVETMKIFGEEATRLQTPDDIGIGLDPSTGSFDYYTNWLKNNPSSQFKTIDILSQLLNKFQSNLPFDLPSLPTGTSGNTITINFDIDKVNNGIETANDLYRQFVANMKLRGVTV